MWEHHYSYVDSASLSAEIRYFSRSNCFMELFTLYFKMWLVSESNPNWSWPWCDPHAWVQQDVTRSTLCTEVNKEKKSVINMEATDVSVYGLFFFDVLSKTDRLQTTPQVLLVQMCHPTYLWGLKPHCASTDYLCRSCLPCLFCRGTPASFPAQNYEECQARVM